MKFPCFKLLLPALFSVSVLTSAYAGGHVYKDENGRYHFKNKLDVNQLNKIAKAHGLNESDFLDAWNHHQSLSNNISITENSLDGKPLDALEVYRQVVLGKVLYNWYVKDYDTFYKDKDRLNVLKQAADCGVGVAIKGYLDCLNYGLLGCKADLSYALEESKKYLFSSKAKEYFFLHAIPDDRDHELLKRCAIQYNWAKRVLSEAYINGTYGFNKNLKKARKCLESAIASGDKIASELLFNYYLQGGLDLSVTLEDRLKSLHERLLFESHECLKTLYAGLLLKANKTLNNPLSLELSFLSLDSKYIERRQLLLSKGVTEGKCWALEQYLNDLMHGGDGCKSNLEKAVQFLRSKLSRQNTWARKKLANCYAEGIGVYENIGKFNKLIHQCLKMHQDAEAAQMAIHRGLKFKEIKDQQYVATTSVDEYKKRYARYGGFLDVNLKMLPVDHSIQFN